MSNLNFSIQDTPYSSYITLRKTFQRNYKLDQVNTPEEQSLNLNDNLIEKKNGEISPLKNELEAHKSKNNL